MNNSCNIVLFFQVVLTEDARRFADQMGIELFETSAKDNINVEEMFRAVTKLVLKSKKVSEWAGISVAFIMFIFSGSKRET